MYKCKLLCQQWPFVLGMDSVFPPSSLTAFQSFYIDTPSGCFVIFCPQETKEEKSSYTCPLCEKICTTQHQLTMHIRQVCRVPALDFLLKSVWFAKVHFAVVKNNSMCKPMKCFHYNFIQLFCFYFSLPLHFLEKAHPTNPTPRWVNFLTSLPSIPPPTQWLKQGCMSCSAQLKVS